jgi:hypothetical protein
MIDRFRDFSNPSQSEARFHDQISKPDLERSGSQRVELMTQLARAQRLQGRFDDGNGTLDEAGTLLDLSSGRAAVRIAFERLRQLAGGESQ